MPLKYLIICCAFIFTLQAGCNNKIDNPFVAVEIPPLKKVADSLFTETATGLKYHDLEKGTGSLAENGYAVQYHFILWLNDGTLVNSSYISGSPQVVILGNNSLIPGWREGLDGMRTGGYRQLIIPPNLGWGANGSPSIGVPPNETLYMELALIGVGIPTDGL